MKKVFYATLALGALILASCQKENQVNLPKVESPVFTALIDNGAPALTATKTVLNGKQSEWNKDHIWVLNGDPDNTSWKKEYKTDATSGTSASFTEVVNSVLKAGPVVAICPTSAGNHAWWNSKFPDFVNNLKLTSTQRAVVGSYDPEAHIAVAYSENTTLPFKNAVSLLKVSVLGTGIENISVSSTDDKIAGDFSYNVKTGVVTTDREEYSNSSKVTLSGTFTDGEDYYIAILPGEYSAFELLVNGISVKKKTSAVTFEGGKIYDLGSVRAPFNWGVVGGLNGWNLSSPVLLYDTDADGIYELKNQNLDGGFKFVRLPDCSWTYELGSHSDSFIFDTEMKGSWYDAWAYNVGNKQKNVIVSDTKKNWDIYLYVPEDPAKVFKFTVVPTGSATPSK